MSERSDSTLEHRTILSSRLERSKVIAPSWIREFFANKISELEFWENNSHYLLDLNIFASHKVPYNLASFEEENLGREAYEKVLMILDNGGKIYLNIVTSPEIVDSFGKNLDFGKKFLPLPPDCSGE